MDFESRKVKKGVGRHLLCFGGPGRGMAQNRPTNAQMNMANVVHRNLERTQNLRDVCGVEMYVDVCDAMCVVFWMVHWLKSRVVGHLHLPPQSMTGNLV